jgi:hypothetical protein
MEGGNDRLLVSADLVDEPFTNMRRFQLALALCTVVLVAAVTMQASITPVVEYPSAGTLTDNRDFTLGYSFTTTTTFNISALGVFRKPLLCWNEIDLG